MEAVVHHLDRLVTMPSQSQMSYRGSSSLHGQSQSQASELCYKSGSSVAGSAVGVSGVVGSSGLSSITSSSGSQRGHSPATYTGSASANYTPMRYIHQSPYAPSPGVVTPVSTFRDFHRENSSRSSAIVSDRQNLEYLRDGPVPGQVKPRISLLQSSDYLALSRNRQLQNENYRDSIGPPNLPPLDVSSSPVKKIRLGEPKDVQRNLRIDTRAKQSEQNEDDGQPAAAYTPQVEAISPTLPSEAQQEDANFRSTKDHLLHGISKVDREISETELQISKLKRKLQELEEAAKKPATQTEEEEVPQPKHQSPAQKIYAENRRKAQEAHMLLKNLGPKIELPLYNQPSDTAVYHENKRRHLLFKKRLLINLRKKHIDRENRQKRLTSTYSLLVQDWLRKVEKIENSQKRKAKDAKNREFFEKIFPKLRKQREDRERFNRVGARVKSEADLEEIMDGLQEQELEDKKMRSYAVVPPLLLDAKQRSIYYINNNGKLDDFAAVYKERQLLNIWTQAEKDIFKEKFLQHPKNFGAIASYLDKKSVCDCVQYYYLSKKTESYKRVLRKTRVTTRSRRNPQSKVNSGNVNSSLAILNTASGVTTRLQREQLQKQEPLQNSTSVSQAHCDMSDFILNPRPHQLNQPLLLPLDKKLEKDKTETKEIKKKKEDEEATDEDMFEPMSNQVIDSKENTAAAQEANSEAMSGGDSENTAAGVACIVCKTESSCTRALPRYQASQYSLKEEDIPPDARVCNLCHCKAVRSRFTNCPILTCPNTKGFRVKRLRPLPCKWADLPPQIKEPIINEFQIDESVTKCCSVCYNRIVRRIGIHTVDTGGSGDSAMPSSPCSLNSWSEEEISNLKRGLKLHGTRWHEVAQIVSTKSYNQCMNFFFKYQKKLGLDQLLPQDMKTSTDERKPVLTDEEESGSSTSSCDEIDAVGVGDSDTTSAPSPVHPPGPLLEEDSKGRSDGTPPPQLIQEGRVSVNSNDLHDRSTTSSSPQGKTTGPGTPSLPPVLIPNREDYDSSATETADEGQGGGETESGANRGPTPKRDEEPSSPLTVKDLMLGVIEMQLKKTQGQGQSTSNPGGAPTISSILKTDHSSVGYLPREKPRQVDNSLATVSVVNTHHSHQSVQELPKEGLVVVQVQQAMRGEQRESEGVTLDLSIKKPRNDNAPQPSASKNVIQHHIPSSTPVQGPHNVFRTSQPSSDHPTYFHQQVLAPPLTPKLSPGIITSAGNTATSKAQCGSIIHGTPVSSPNLYSQPRYEPSQTSLIHHTSPHKETGSITQGTPVHQRGSLYTPQNAEYFHKRLPSSAYYPTRPPAYNVELEQRQIIMNDYITSQQMHAPSSSSGSRNGREKLYYQSPRQGVIQRHNTKPPSPGASHYPPGHEAFSSLVDVAVRQPSLPVPPHSGIPPLSDMKTMQEEKRHLHEGLGERFNRESSHERYSSRESENRYIKENSKIHNPPTSVTPQSQERREMQQQSLIQLRDPSHSIRDQMPINTRDQMSHGSRESYRHLDRGELQQHQMQQSLREQQPIHRERSEHHSQQSQKIRDHHHHIQQQRERDHDIRSSRGQMPNFSQRIIHEPHHSIDQRLIQVSNFREQPTSTQQSSMSSHSSSRGHSQQEQSIDVQQQGSRSRSNEGSTLTAASLIDAIITHQINQSSDSQTTSTSSGTANTQQSQPTRPGDRLFQSFHRECNESNGKISPLKGNVYNSKEEVSKQQQQQQQPQQQQPQHQQQQPPTSQQQQQQSQQQSQQQQSQQPQPPPSHHVVTTSVHIAHQQVLPPNEHMDVYNSGPPQGMRSVLYHGFDPQTWKLRRALQPKDVEQNHPSMPYSSEPPVPLSPLDYVKNRIAEVMRTSEEEGASTKGNESPAPSEINTEESPEPAIISTTSFITQSHTYTYPFSALSLSAGATTGVPPPSIPPPKVTKPITESIPEPAPLLSAQYDPLSDED
ncbi:nuclear receptor corepressor 1 isoform X2 [Cimex lectularius]|uniref:Nuclear receptor corepressor 1 n=1 Tax=Cimex lectularius TaxID=79782 RepID=A0A8I6SQ82_CIMLE|nr:nuclear receptor corepressor 1 isoform X2 [Cimex lectularius]